MPDDLDQLIDFALADYTAVEPLAGLEQRVLHRVRAASTRRRLLALAAAPVFAAIVVMVMIPKPRPLTTAKVTPPPVETPASQVAVIAPAPPVVRHKARRPHRTLTPPPPKRDYFPTITPVTAQERLLAELAKEHPQELLSRPADQLEIKPLEIAPLSADGTH